MYKLKRPLFVTFDTKAKETMYNEEMGPNGTLFIPVFGKKIDTLATINHAVKKSNCDYLFLLASSNGEFDVTKAGDKNSEILNATNMRLSWLAKIKDSQNKTLPLINFVRNENTNQAYLINPQYDKKTGTYVAIDGTDIKGSRFVASDNVVTQRLNQFDSQADWEKHQSDVIKRFKAVMPLNNQNKKELTSAKRGLKEDELGDFFSWRTNMNIAPGVFGDDMIGIPSVKATAYDNIELSAGDAIFGSGALLNLKTGGKRGYMIPMKTPEGNIPKYQIGADVSPINLILKAKAKDSISIEKTEIYSEKNKKYKFKLKNGQDANLHLVQADDNSIIFNDVNGNFNVKLGQDIKNILNARNYDLPPIIDNIKPTKTTKYMWMSRGDMVPPAKEDAPDYVSPSNPGFIEAKKPQNGSNEYVVLVAEGALKGVITSKYIDRPDKTGKSLADKIAGNRGIIVAQVPGVAESFVAGVPRVYKGKNIVGTYIAMDADGRTNYNVARGIHSAYDHLKQFGPVKVMSWDPKQKGIDDSLLAISQGKITVDQMDLHFGTPDRLFPYNQTHSTTPYDLKGNRVKTFGNTPTWLREYKTQKTYTNEKFYKAQTQNNSKINIANGYTETEVKTNTDGPDLHKYYDTVDMDKMSKYKRKKIKKGLRKLAQSEYDKAKLAEKIKNGEVDANNLTREQLNVLNFEGLQDRNQKLEDFAHNIGS